MVIFNLKEVNQELNPKQQFRVWKKGVKDLPNTTYLRLNQDDDYNEIDLQIVDYNGREISCGTIGILESSGKLCLWDSINKESKLHLNNDGRIILENTRITCEEDTEVNKNKFKFKVWEKGVPDNPKTTYFRLKEELPVVTLIAVNSDGMLNGAGYILKITEKGKLDLTNYIGHYFGLTLDSNRQLVLNNSKEDITYGGGNSGYV